MDMRGMLRGLGSKAGQRTSTSSEGVRASFQPFDPDLRLAMLDAFEEAEIGWFWATDAANRVTYLSASAIAKFGEGRAMDRGQSILLLRPSDPRPLRLHAWRGR